MITPKQAAQMTPPDWDRCNKELSLKQ